MSSAAQGINIQPFLPVIDELVRFVDQCQHLTDAKLTAVYSKLHAATAACPKFEANGRDCPLTKCFKTARTKLPTIVFLKMVDLTQPKNIGMVDLIYKRVIAQFSPAQLQQSELQLYYTTIRNRVQTASFLESLESVKPQTMAHAAEIYQKTSAESVPTAYKLSDLELAWMSVNDIFEKFRDLQALDQQTAKESFGRFGTYRVIPLTEAGLIANAVKSLRAACDLSFPKIDIREDVIPSTQRQQEEIDQAEALALAESGFSDEIQRIGTDREELAIYGLIGPRDAAQVAKEMQILDIAEPTPEPCLADMILNDLLGGVVDDLNKIFKARAARRLLREQEATAQAAANRPISVSPELVGTFDLTPPDVAAAIAAETSPDQGSPTTSDSAARASGPSKSTTPEADDPVVLIEDVRIQEKQQGAELVEVIDEQERSIAAPQGYVDISAYSESSS